MKCKVFYDLAVIIDWLYPGDEETFWVTQTRRLRWLEIGLFTVIPAGYQKALKCGNIVLRPKELSEVDKLDFLMFYCTIQNVAIYAWLIQKYFIKKNVFISIFGRLLSTLWEALWETWPPCERPGLSVRVPSFPVRGLASLWEA